MRQRTSSLLPILVGRMAQRTPPADAPVSYPAFPLRSSDSGGSVSEPESRRRFRRAREVQVLFHLRASGAGAIV